VDLGRLGGRLDLLVARPGPREGQVLAHRPVEQVGLLRDHADDAPQRVEGEVAHIGSVDPHRPRADIVEPRDQVPERRLAGSRLAHDGHLATRLGHERDPLQDGRGVGVVAEADVVELDAAMHVGPVEGHRVGPLVDVHRQVEVLEDAVEQRQRGLHVGLHREQRGDGEEERVCRVVKATRVPIEIDGPPDASR